jgi:hypothetical protein
MYTLASTKGYSFVEDSRNILYLGKLSFRPFSRVSTIATAFCSWGKLYCPPTGPAIAFGQGIGLTGQNRTMTTRSRQN